MAYWFDQMDQTKGWKYPDQIAFLRGNHGIPQAHASALVMYCRRSATSWAPAWRGPTATRTAPGRALH